MNYQLEINLLLHASLHPMWRLHHLCLLGFQDYLSMCWARILPLFPLSVSIHQKAMRKQDHVIPLCSLKGIELSILFCGKMKIFRIATTNTVPFPPAIDSHSLKSQKISQKITALQLCLLRINLTRIFKRLSEF